MSSDALSVRVDELSRRVTSTEEELRHNRPAVLSTQITEMGKDVDTLSSEVRGLRRAVIAFAFTVAASAVGFAITVILVWGGHA